MRSTVTTRRLQDRRGRKSTALWEGLPRRPQSSRRSTPKVPGGLPTVKNNCPDQRPWRLDESPTSRSRALRPTVGGVKRPGPGGGEGNLGRPGQSYGRPIGLPLASNSTSTHLPLASKPRIGRRGEAGLGRRCSRPRSQRDGRRQRDGDGWLAGLCSTLPSSPRSRSSTVLGCGGSRASSSSITRRAIVSTFSGDSSTFIFRRHHDRLHPLRSIEHAAEVHAGSVAALLVADFRVDP
jgi:hypothetical protein